MKPKCIKSKHRWTREHEEGLTENPGVWCEDGYWYFVEHCKHCGLKYVNEHPDDTVSSS